MAEAVIVTEPKLIPFTAGEALGVVCPSATKTLPDTSVTFDVSLLDNETVTPPAGAGVPRVRISEVCWPGATDSVAGRDMELCTVTLAVVSARYGDLLAWITVLPDETIVNGTATVVEPCGIVTVEGTVPTLGLLEDKLMAKPPDGACPDRVKVRFCVPLPENDTVGGVKARVAVTGTIALPEEYPAAVALMFADPRLTPAIVGC